MNKSIVVLKEIYRPLKYTLKGKVTILTTTSGNLVIKKKGNQIKELYHYLTSRGFSNFPRLIDDSRQGVNVFAYLPDIEMPTEQRAEDLIKLVALLHHKTTFFKEVSPSKYQAIYEAIMSNIDYLRYYYNQLYDTLFQLEMPDPASYLLLRNIYKIFLALNFSENELTEWYDLVKEEAKQRISLIHNNLELEHFIKNEQDYLISWEKARIDTPIIDLIQLYQREYFKFDFKILLEKYLAIYPLSEAELKLFFILITLPPKIELKSDYFQSCKVIRSHLDYIFKTEELMRPYYSKEQEKQSKEFNQ